MTPPSPNPGSVDTTDLLRRDREARRLAQTEFEIPLALEAGAGTGKTTTLVARVLAWCLGKGWELHRESLAASRSAGDPPPGPHAVAARVLGGVVAITFTEAAAAEMATRLGLELADLAEGRAPMWLDRSHLPPLASEREASEAEESGDGPGDGEDTLEARARAVAGVLDHLAVRTIHAFCRSLLAEFPLEAELHPNLEVDADGSQLEEVVRETVEAALPKAYGDPGDERYLTLAAREIGPREIAETVMELVAKGVRAEDLAEDPLGAASLARFGRRLLAVLEPLGGIGTDLVGASGRAKKAKEAGEQLGALEVAARSLVETTEEGASREALRALVDLDLGSLSSSLGEWSKGRFNKTEEGALDTAQSERLTAAAPPLRALVQQLQSLDPELLEPARSVVAELVAAVRLELRGRGVVTFSDLLAEARDLLVRRPGVCAQIRRRIDQLLVDEFQDTDLLQCEVLERLAFHGPVDERPGLFLVGDPKQSIYGWRNADLRAYDGFLQTLRDHGGSTYPLVENFRSVPRILDEVERAVAPVMHHEEGRQPAFQPLVACEARRGDTGFDRAPWQPLEYWISWGPGDDGTFAPLPSAQATALEARALARDLLRLHRDEGVPWSDVGILLRSGSDLDDYLDALRRAGIPFAVGRDKQYYRRREIIDAAGVVRAVLDPGDTVALVTFLRCVAVGVPDAALVPLWSAELPRALMAEAMEAENSAVEGAPEGAPESAVARAVARAAETVPRDVPGLERLEGWETALLAACRHLMHLRRLMRSGSAHQVVTALRALIPLEILEAGRYMGRYRLANLDRFFRQLRDALDEGRDVPGLLRLLRRSVAEAQDAEEARPKDVGGEAVQVMTIHGAKGLDFRHVYLLQLHKGQRSGSPPRTDVGRLWTEGGAGALNGAGPLEYVLFGTPTPGWSEVAAETEARETAERVRLLYVAMTRAKDRLVLAGGWKADAGGEKSPSGAAGSFLDLLDHRPPRTLAELMTERVASSGGGEPDETDDEALWRLPELEDDLEEDGPVEAERAPLPPPEAVEADHRRLTELRREARRRQARPVSRPASAAAHGELREAMAEQLEAADEGTPLTSSPATGDARAIAMAAGTAVHRALETFDLEADLEQEMGRQRQRLLLYLRPVTEPRLEAAALDRAEELWTALDPAIPRRLQSLTEHLVARELPLLLPADPMVDVEASAPLAFYSGTADLVYRDPETGSVVVADYKTDLPDADEEGLEAWLEARSAVYASQGEVYRRAVSEALDLDPPAVFELWFLASGRVVRLS